MKSKTRAIGLLLMCFIMIIISCRKNTGDLPEPTSGPANEGSAGISALTSEIAEILMQVYKNEKAHREVNAAIFCGYYADERVLLRDLLFPATSELYRMESFKKFNVDTGYFRRAFCEILEWGNYPSLKSAFTHFRDHDGGPLSGTVAINGEYFWGINVHNTKDH